MPCIIKSSHIDECFNLTFRFNCGPIQMRGEHNCRQIAITCGQTQFTIAQQQWRLIRQYWCFTYFHHMFIWCTKRESVLKLCSGLSGQIIIQLTIYRVLGVNVRRTNFTLEYNECTRRHWIPQNFVTVLWKARYHHWILITLQLSIILQIVARKEVELSWLTGL